MNIKQLSLVLIIGAGGIIIGAALAPSFNGISMMGTRGGITGTTIDRHFIEEMIPHHEGAIAMADLALSRSKRPEILSLAAGIKESQTRENSDMRSWYQSWFGASVPAYSSGMMGGMMHGGLGMMGGMSGDLETLKTAENFDLEFIEEMIPHHEMAIMMARMLLAGTKREEMRTLADQIITSQSREIEMMRSWYGQWK